MKKKPKLPPKRRLRHVWSINPKTRVKPSARKYQRTSEKQRSRQWVEEADADEI